MTKRKTPFFTFKGLSNSPIFQYHIFKLVATRSVETSFLRAARYANVSLTHSVSQEAPFFSPSVGWSWSRGICGQLSSCSPPVVFVCLSVLSYVVLLLWFFFNFCLEGRRGLIPRRRWRTGCCGGCPLP